MSRHKTAITIFIITAAAGVAVWLFGGSKKTPSEIALNDALSDIDVTPEDALRAETLHEVMRACISQLDVVDYIVTNDWLNSDLEFLTLYKAFGVKPYDYCKPEFLDWAYKNRDLWQWLYMRTDQGEKNEINAVFESRGITFRV